MAGLFGIFGNKDQGEDFYLDEDQAKTWGDIDYMRRPQEVKKTFPKIAGGKPVVPPTITPKASFDTPNSTNGSSPQFTSPLTQAAIEAPQSTENNFTEPSNSTTSAPTEQQPTENNSTQTPSVTTPAPTQQRQVDSNMDIFLDMARKMNRR